MLFFIDFATQDGFRTFYCQGRNLFAQGFARTVYLLLNICFCLSGNTGSLVCGLSFRLIHNLGGSLLGIGYHCGNLIPAFSQEFCNFFLCLLKIAFTALGSSQALGDFISALIQCFGDGRPYIAYGEANQNQKDD